MQAVDPRFDGGEIEHDLGDKGAASAGRSRCGRPVIRQSGRCTPTGDFKRANQLLQLTRDGSPSWRSISENRLSGMVNQACDKRWPKVMVEFMRALHCTLITQ